MWLNELLEDCGGAGVGVAKIVECVLDLGKVADRHIDH